MQVTRLLGMNTFPLLFNLSPNSFIPDMSSRIQSVRVPVETMRDDNGFPFLQMN